MKKKHKHKHQSYKMYRVPSDNLEYNGQMMAFVKSICKCGTAKLLDYGETMKMKDKYRGRNDTTQQNS